MYISGNTDPDMVSFFLNVISIALFAFQVLLNII
jgi:hypothetical protein